MIRWKRLEAGEYESEDGRFYVIRSYDRIYGEHWILRDKKEENYFKGQYHETTLRDCKAVAEVIGRENSHDCGCKNNS